VLIARVAALTSRIRVGAGGVMLPNHSPLRIAEAFRLLEALSPGRIDLGLGRAPGTDGVTAYALRRGAPGAEDFPQQLAELLAHAGGGFPDDHPFARVAAEPRDVPLPPVWILGSSDHGAAVAAAMGVGFAFARHLNPRGAREAVARYRAGFRPGPLAEPRVILAVSAVCADTAGQAERLASSMGLGVIRLRSGRPGPLPSPDEALAYGYTEGEEDQLRRYRRAQVVGDPGEVRDRLAALRTETGADELMVMTMVHDHAARVRSYELLAHAWGVRAAAAA
jgi:luciferase family oxidoreductase group 1